METLKLIMTIQQVSQGRGRLRRSLKEELEFGNAGEIPLEDGALQFSFSVHLRKVNTT